MVGIDAKNKNIVDMKYICPLCSLILRDPIQLISCGHRLCQTCIKSQDEMIIRCRECFVETRRSEMMIDRAFKKDMQSLLVECSFCRWVVLLNNYQDHLDQKHPSPKCEHCNQRFNSVKDLNEHMVLQCQKRTVDCLLKNVGCDDQINHGHISEHYWSEQHQQVLLKAVYLIKIQIENAEVSSIQMTTDFPRSTTVTPVNPDTTGFQELFEMCNIPSDDIDISSDDGQEHLNNALLQCQNNFPTSNLDFLKVKLSVQENNGCLVDPAGKKDLTLSNEMVGDSKYFSEDGAFIWKITNIKERRTDAQSERHTSIYSPPFYSSPTGYKMRLRLYLHGDGNARRTHMSLFFILMRGVNDAILKFPFSYKVTFCLYDQTPQQKHIIDSFRPDIKSNSFQRPRSEMNIASGIPKFLPLQMIQQEGNAYVRDDTMFIKVMIDFGDLRKTLLPYALGLNPGLPTHVQRTMIRQEAERRTQQ